MFAVSTARFTFVNHPFNHRKTPFRESCALVTAADFALRIKKNGRMITEERKMASYKQFGFMSSVFSGYNNAISIVRGPERGKRSKVPASHSGEQEAARTLCSEQK